MIEDELAAALKVACGLIELTGKESEKSWPESPKRLLLDQAGSALEEYEFQKRKVCSLHYNERSPFELREKIPNDVTDDRGTRTRFYRKAYVLRIDRHFKTRPQPTDIVVHVAWLD